MSSNSNDTSFLSKNKMEGEVVGLRPTRCLNLLVEKINILLKYTD